MFNKKVILITGGTGSFGKKFISMLLEKYNPLTKSLVDAFESSKDKHMSRFSLIAENGDPKLLLHAQERKSAAMLNGEVYNIPNEIDLSDVNTNMEVLKNINYQGANP